MEKPFLDKLPIGEHLLSERDIAVHLGVSLATVRRWRLLARGPKYLKIGSSVRYAPSDLKAFVDSLPVGGGVGSGVRDDR